MGWKGDSISETITNAKYNNPTKRNEKFFS